MPSKSAKTSGTRTTVRRARTVASKSASPGTEKRRFWLTYPTKLITRPVIWEMTRRYPVVFNVRQASVTDEMGILCLELEASRQDIKAAIAWLEKQGVKVEPVEINVIES